MPFEVLLFLVLAELSPVTAQPRETWTFAINGRILRCEAARTQEQQMRGLQGRALAADECMVFVYRHPAVRSFSMKNTAAPLSALFLDAQWRVTEIKRLRPLDSHPVVSSAPVLYAGKCAGKIL